MFSVADAEHLGEGIESEIIAAGIDGNNGAENGFIFFNLHSNLFFICAKDY
ncbi:MAG: hypothetical protein NTW65_11555 [Deltaproteobacteria bacterium]|nr:hypothetical protein [Deltaproteobacteria bacterium]